MGGLAWVRPPAHSHYATEPLCGTPSDAAGGGCTEIPDSRDDDRGKDDGKDTSRHSVEDDKQTATTPNPDDYK